MENQGSVSKDREMGIGQVKITLPSMELELQAQHPSIRNEDWKSPLGGAD